MGKFVRHTDWERQRERLSAYLDGELSATERVALETHLPGCDECQRELAALRQTRALLRALPTPVAPRSFALPSQPAMAQPRSRGALRWTRPIQIAGSIAAMIGLGLLIASALPHVTHQPLAAGAASTASESHTIGGASNPSTVPAYSTDQASNTGGSSSTYAPSTPEHAQAQAAAPFPALPVSGMTLLVGGAAGVAAGSLARRRARRAGTPEPDEAEQAS